MLNVKNFYRFNGQLWYEGIHHYEISQKGNVYNVRIGKLADNGIDFKNYVCSGLNTVMELMELSENHNEC